MTLKFLDLYNEVAGQAWSMFDPDAESKEDFETALKSSINKALSALWNSYDFSFREKTKSTNTSANKNKYNLPNGSIIKKVVNGEEKFGVKLDGEYLTYNSDAEILEAKTGTPKYFYVSGDYIYLYPTPDKSYKLTYDYSTLEIGLSEDGNVLYELSDDNDYINIPTKYESIFKNALITLSMVYAIADETDENYAGYLSQYNKAYDILLEYQKGIEKNKRISW